MDEIESLKRAVLGGDWSPSTLRALADAQESASQEAAMRRLLRVGARVRVPRGDGTARAMISSLDGDEMEVVYDEGDEDEAVLACSDARALESFEESGFETAETADAATNKERGSVLFKLKDYAAAADYYKKVLAVMKGKLSVGALVMLNYKNQLKVGTVSCLEKDTVDVTYDDDDDDDDDVPRKCVVLVLPNDEGDRILLLTTYLNLARCATRVARFKDAVTCATLASGIAQAENRTDHHITAKIIRARAHLAQSHLKQAIRDAAAATDLSSGAGGASSSSASSSSSSNGPTDVNKQVLALNRDVEKAKRLALKANKRLAKDVTEWVSSAQSKFAENGGNDADCNQQ